MGVFQSVGGAATSGKGLHDSHIRSAIIAALKQSEESNKERREELFNKIAGGERASKLFAEGDYSAEQSTECAVGAESNAPDASESAHDELSVVEYAPDVFAALRRLSGTSTKDFKNEWTRAPPKANTPADKKAAEGNKMELGEGRSGALFLKSKSMAFMCKTISETEVQVLVGILKKYLKFLEKNPNSMLMRFVMMLRVTLKGEVGYILCFADCFSNCDVLHERWDLKGRKPKPGKFRHFAKHNLKKNTVESDQKGADDNGDTSTDSEDEEAVKKSQQKKTDNVRTADSRKALKLLTYKDKNLARLFWLEPNIRTELMSQFHNDFAFLNSCGLMDYSILIGVRYNTPEETVEKEITRDRDALGGRAMHQVFALGDETRAGAVEVRKKEDDQLNSTRAFLTAMNSKSSKFHQGVDNIECVETYYIGIIDMLTVYNAKKMTANFCKTFLWRSNTLSTIPPVPYRKRIEKFAHQIFPLVEVADEQLPDSPSGIQGKHDRMVRVASIRKGKTSTGAGDDDDDAADAYIMSDDDDNEAFLSSTQYNADDSDDPSALHAAAVEGNVPLIKRLISAQQNLNARDSSGRTPLHNAVKSGKYAAVQEFIRAKASVTIADRNGHTPLHVAALEGRSKIAKLLIGANSELDARDMAGCTPLHLAVENYNQDVVEVLIDAKADLNLTEEEGMTALKCALNNGDEEMAGILRRSGALE